MKPKFDPKEYEFPDGILCELCTHYDWCEENSESCKALDALEEDMEGVE